MSLTATTDRNMDRSDVFGGVRSLAVSTEDDRDPLASSHKIPEAGRCAATVHRWHAACVGLHASEVEPPFCRPTQPSFKSLDCTL
jgi:hypothetical protein